MVKNFSKLNVLFGSATFYAKANGINYSTFMHGLKLAGIDLNRKMLSEIAIADKEGFTALVEKAKAALN